MSVCLSVRLSGLTVEKLLLLLPSTELTDESASLSKNKLFSLPLGGRYVYGAKEGGRQMGSGRVSAVSQEKRGFIPLWTCYRSGADAILFRRIRAELDDDFR